MEKPECFEKKIFMLNYKDAITYQKYMQNNQPTKDVLMHNASPTEAALRRHSIYYRDNDNEKNMKRYKLQAIRKSIKHWMLDIVKPLKTDTIKICNTRFFGEVLVWSKTHEYVKVFPDKEPLCLLKKEMQYYCIDCPLYLTTKQTCHCLSGAYSKFRNNLTIFAAKDMVRALVCTYWAETEDNT